MSVIGTFARRKKKSSRTRKALLKRRAHARAEAGAIVRRYKQATSSPNSGKLRASALGDLRSTLDALRSEIARDGGSKVVVSALEDLDTSLTKLAHASQTTDLKASAQLLKDGVLALNKARAKAKAAGHDWSL